LAVRIGLAFNLKPSAPADTTAGAPTDPSASDDPNSRALRDDLPPDLYAEWDEPATIDAVERALSTVGQAPPEANASFPARLALIRPDFVFNIAEGLYGPNREGHVPAICEFLDIPCHASDPLTLGLALDKRRAKEVMSYHGVPTAPFVLARSPADARNVQLPFPLFVKPAFEGSGSVSVRSRARSQLVKQVPLLATYAEPVLIETHCRS
jgi:D-alanine-D-alanine ligase